MNLRRQLATADSSDRLQPMIACAQFHSGSNLSGSNKDMFRFDRYPWGETGDICGRHFRHRGHLRGCHALQNNLFAVRKAKQYVTEAIIRDCHVAR